MDMDLVIKGGTLVTATATYEADVGIQGQKIVAIGRDLSGHQEVDAGGMLVTPGAIDPHVHLAYRLPGGLHSADDFYSGTRAAAFGGTTTVIDFVEPAVEQSMVDALAQRRAEADPQVVIDYGLHMTISPAEIEKLDQVPAAYEAGCASFKLYMAYAFRLDDGQMVRALEAVGAVGGLPVVHAENWDVITMLIERHLAAGKTAPRWHPRSRPALMEAEAAGRAIDMAALVGSRLHIFHISCAEVITRVAEAQHRGQPVSGETCPQYLMLTADLFEQAPAEAALPVCSPPLRSAADQERLWAALGEDVLNIVSTDHCPFTRAEKEAGLENFSQIPGGVPSIEARFPLLFTFGVRLGRFSTNRWVDMCCTRPAQLFGLSQKGHIGVGYDADLVLFDPERLIILSSETLHEQVDWTPYEGLSLRGWPAMTISRGEIIVAEGECRAEPGRGRFVPRRF